MTTSLRIEKLRRGHAVDALDCGREELNRFLHRFALTSQQAGAAQTRGGEKLALLKLRFHPDFGAPFFPPLRSIDLDLPTKTYARPFTV